MKKQVLVGLCAAALPLTGQATDSKWNTDFAVGLEYGYDDNVIVDEIDLASSSGDDFFRFRGKGDVEFSPNEKDEFSAGISFSELQYNGNDQFDLRTILASAGYKRKINKYTLGFDIHHADAELGGDGFLTLTQISPSVSTFINRQHFLRGAYTYIHKDLDSTNVRDADSDEFSLDYYYFKNGLTQYFIVSGKLRFDDADDDELDYWSYQLRSAYKQRYHIFEQKNQLTIEFRYRDRDYDEIVNSTINDFRRDKRTTFSIENSWRATDNLDVILEYEYVDNESSLDSFDFDENAYSIALNYDF